MSRIDGHARRGLDPVLLSDTELCLRRAGAVLRELNGAPDGADPDPLPFEEVLAVALLRDACASPDHLRARDLRAGAAARALDRVASTLERADRRLSGLVVPPGP